MLSKAEAEKEKVRAIIEKHIGAMHPVTRRRKSWLKSGDGKLSVFMTFSRYYTSAQPWWYDIDPNDIKQWLCYEKAFIVFVMEEHTRVLIIPAKVIQKLVNGLEPKGYGEYKLHVIEEAGEYKFCEMPDSMTEFYNSYLLLTD